MQQLRLLLCLIALASTSSLLGQKPATSELGFNPEKVYDFREVDAVNLFNGNVTVTLPIGPRYQVSSSLSYQFTLAYNSTVWESETYECYDRANHDAPMLCTHIVPDRRSNSGLGWRLSLGRLLPPYEPSLTKSSFKRDGWMYEGPAGDEHELTQMAGDSLAIVAVSTDPVPFRMNRINDSTRDVEFPNGEIHRFVNKESGWQLSEMRDRFGNKVTVLVEPELVNGVLGEKWSVTDDVGRSHTVRLTPEKSMKEGWSRGQTIRSVILDGFEGEDLTYTFSYTTATCGESEPLLKEITRPAPDTTPYKFTYTGASHCGALAKATFPAGGSVAYTYQVYGFAVPGDFCWNAPFGAGSQKGVATRTVSDGVTSRVWQYVQRRGPLIAHTDANMCDTVTGVPNSAIYGPFYWSRTSVIEPLDADNKRVRNDHYFNIYNDVSNAYALPFGYAGVEKRPPDDRAKGSVTEVPEDTQGYPADVSGEIDGRYLSSRVYSGCSATGDCTNGTLLRSTYVSHECNEWFKCWAKTSRVVYEDDRNCGGACYTQETSSDRTVTGLHKTTTTASNFPAPGKTCTSASPCPETVTSTSYTAYTDWSSGDRYNLQKAWLTGIYTSRTRTEAGVTSRTDYQFSTSTGALEGVRVLKGSALGKTDLLTTFVRDAAGNVIQEANYGGDGASLATDAEACCATPATGLQYLTRHTYTKNFLTKSEAIDPNSCTDVKAPGCVALLTLRDQSFDEMTGLVTSSRDAAGVQTLFNYDKLGRLVSVTPAGLDSRTYAYTAASGSDNARVTETVGSIATNTYELDGLGRVRRTSNSLPNAKVAAVQTEYDQRGRRRRVSQPVEQNAHPTSSIGTDWTTFTYDAFDRETSVKAPDASVTSFSHTGVRKVVRTASVQMKGGAGDAKSIEYYDALGRLVMVEEDAANTSAATTTGGKVTTSYAYDVEGRLSNVSMTAKTTTTTGTDTDTEQTRQFLYDRRGFLTSETHPENGTTTYSSYDSRGLAGERTVGARTLKFTYDAAARLTKVDEKGAAGSEKALKTFEFASANTTAGTVVNLSKGKLVKAVRRNDLPAAGTIDVTETYEYATPSGQMSKRSTLVEQVSGSTRTPIQKFEYSVAYDAQGQPNKLTMPTCSLHGCAAANGIPSVTFGRTAGFLTSVGNLATLTYHPSGMVASVVHQSTPIAKDTYAASHGMARPSSITFDGGTACAKPAPPAISTEDTVCPNSTANTASVATREGVTHTWAITGGTITSATTADSITYTAPASGTFRLTVTAVAAACDVPSSSSVTVTVRSAPSPSAISTEATACPSSSGNKASVSPRDGVTHTWTISGGGAITSGTSADTITYTAPESGSVTLSVTAGNACGTSAPHSTTVTVQPTLEPSTIAADGPVCAGSTNVAYVDARHGVTHSWSISEGGTITSAASGDSITYTAPASGSVTLTVTAANGCGISGPGSATIAVEAATEMTPSDIWTDGAVCPDSEGNVAYVDHRSGVTHTWTVSGGTLTSAASADTITYTAPAAGFVTLTVTAANVCGASATRSANIPLESAPEPPVISAAATVCPSSTGNKASVTDTGATFDWTITGGTITSGTTGRIITYTAGASGSVTLTATATNACGIGTASSLAVPIRPAPVSPSISTAAAVCPSSTGNTASVEPSAGVTHNWAITGGTITSAASGERITYTAPASGDVKLTVTAVNACSTSEPSSLTVAVRSAPAPSPVSTSATVCPSSTGNRAAVAPRTGITHNWTITGGTITSATSGDTITYTAPASGDVTLTVTAVNVCNASTPSSARLTVQSAPTASPISTAASVCPNATGNTASVAPRTGITHTWAIDGGTITSATSGQSITYTAPASGNVRLTVTAVNACNLTTESSATVTLQSAPTAQPIAMAASVCPSSTGNTASVAGRVGVTHNWTISGGTITSAATGESVTYTAPASGNVTLTVTAVNACNASTSSSATAAVRSAPPASPITTASTVCPTSAGNTASVVPRAGITHAWAISGGMITSAASGETITYTAPASGNVTLTVTAMNACNISTSSSATVTLQSPPAASPISTAPTVCPSSTGNTASVGARAGITHQWAIAGGTITSGTSGEAITYTAPASGTVTLSVTAVNACNASASSSASVAVQSPPTASAIAAPAAACGGSTGHQASVAQRAGISHTWTIAGGTITSSASGDLVTFTAGNSGTVTLTVAAANACGATTESSLAVPITTLPTAVVSGSTRIVRGGEATVTAQLTGASPWRVTWSDGYVQSDVTAATTSRIVTPDVTTTYSITSVSSAGCTGTSSGLAVVTVAPPAPATVTATTVANTNVTVTWTAVAGASEYRIERTGRLGDAATWTTSVAATATSYSDVVPASVGPVTYIYYVRAVAYGETSDRGAWDHATAATVLYVRPVVTPAQSAIFAGDVAELRGAIDALRYALKLPSAFGAVAAPSGAIAAADFTALVTALNGARTAIAQPPFTYVNVSAPASGTIVRAAHIEQLREAVR